MVESIFRHTAKAVMIMATFTFVGTLGLVFIHEFSKDKIEVNESIEKMKSFAQVLPATAYDNKPLEDFVNVPAGGELNNRSATKIYVAKLAGVATAVILETTARNGYSGDIKLLMAVRSDGSISGVRVIAHKETPGLGDYIDVLHGDWIKAFNQLSLATRPSAQWKVKKDGGKFDYMAGATITPRAVVNITQKALHYVETNSAKLFATQK